LDIRARLVKNIPKPDKNRAETMILDEFTVVKDVNLNSGDEYNVSYSYLLPINSPSGQYKIYFYAVEQNKFNLSGLLYASDIAVSKISFDVNGNNPDHVYLDQTQIKINKTPYNVKNHDTLVSGQDKIEVTIPLFNPHDTAIHVDVIYDLYSFDSSDTENKINTKTERILLSPKKAYLLSYIIDKPEVPVYNLSITSKPTNQIKDESVYKEKTISNIRFSIDSIYKPRLIFVGIDSYPLKSETSLVTCFIGAGGVENEENYKIETIVQGENGMEISKESYFGPIFSDMKGLIQKINTNKTITNFTVLSSIVDSDGRILEKISKKYSCQDINPNNCPQVGYLSWWMILIVCAVAFLLIVMVVFKRKTINIERV